jgi:hypothetical protein
MLHTLGHFPEVGGEQRGPAPQTIREANLVARKKDTRAGVHDVRDSEPGPPMTGRNVGDRPDGTCPDSSIAERYI